MSEPFSLDNAKQQYLIASTHKDKAIIEEDIWINRKDNRRGGKQLHYIRTALGLPYISSNEIKLRHYILKSKCSDLLFQRIDAQSSELPLDTAYRLWLTACNRATKNGSSIELEMVKALKEYDSWPVVNLPSGKLMRKAPLSSLSNPTDVRKRIGKQKKIYNFWSNIRNLVTDYLAEQIPGLDPIDISRSWIDFESDLKSAFDRLRNAVSKHKKDRKSSESARSVLGRSKILDACDILNIPRPDVGSPINLKEATQKYRAMAREYHPDRGNSTDATISLYRQAVSAFETLEQYNAQLGEQNGQKAQ